jgi:tRNA(fMet)-specific endonuclease VapC
LIFLLDKNAFSAILRGRIVQVRRRFDAAVTGGHDIMIPVIVLHELHFGAWRSSDPARNLERIGELLGSLNGIAPFEIEDAKIAGKLRAGLATRGEGIGPFDSLIAAQALRLGATLVTGNIREFARVPGLKWEDWQAT